MLRSTSTIVSIDSHLPNPLDGGRFPCVLNLILISEQGLSGIATVCLVVPISVQVDTITSWFPFPFQCILVVSRMHLDYVTVLIVYACVCVRDSLS
jgi:hypothetical protein